MKKKEKNVIVYYASEENAFEFVRVTDSRSNMLSRIRTTMIDDDGLSEEDADNNIKSLKGGLEKDGYAYVEFESCTDYDMIVGIAYHGKTKNITDLIKERRQEIVSMF